MTNSELQLRSVADPRLALHATSTLPAWLFALDGSRVLWANPPGARAFGAANSATLAARTLGPADERRRQITQLARRLPEGGAVRLERLRGFGVSLGLHITCTCARLDFPDGGQGLLIAPVEACGRIMPLAERLRRLVEGIDRPVAAFARDGLFVGGSDAVHPLLGFHDLTEAGLDGARKDALAQGRAETPIGHDRIVLQRVGRGADIGLVAFIAPTAAQAGAPGPVPSIAARQISAAAEPPLTTPETPNPSAAADITPFDALAEGPDPQQQPQPPTHPTEEATVTLSREPPHAPNVTGTPSVSGATGAPAAEPRRHPLRFTWQSDADGRFTVNSDEFIRLTGAETAAALGRPWHDIASTLGLDPDFRVTSALATRDTWSGIMLDWPVDGGGNLPVELSGLPVYDATRNFIGYRGFGVCRDLDGLAALAALRQMEPPRDQPEPRAGSIDIDLTHSGHHLATDPPPEGTTPPAAVPGSPVPIDVSAAQPTDSEQPVETPPNVVPFRPPGSDAKSPALTPVENHAFDELARQLSERLENGNGNGHGKDEAHPPEAVDAAPAPPAELPPATEPPRSQPDWLAQPEPPPRGESERDRTLLDLLPTGVLIYRLDRLLYANPAFLTQMGYPNLHALEQAGGVDALYVEAGTVSGSSTSEAGTPVKISVAEETGEATASIDARLFTISWDGDSALALMFAPTQAEPAAVPVPEPVAVTPPSAVGHANAEELGAILDTTAEGIIMFDAGGNIHACNRSAEALFGYDGDELVRRNLTELFAPESRRLVLDYLESVKGTGLESLLEHGRDVLGRVSKGGLIPLSMTMGRTRPDGPNFFAVFRDVSQSRKNESELQQARRLAETVASAKADLLARISHEARAPLNAIIGFAEVMIGERFGALGNERYVDYMKDIRASGERVTAMLNDLLELSRIETGKLDLAFTNQNLNELVESCVAAMQPRANRERIIVRTSLAPALPSVVADARALRQIALNLIGNSIQLAKSGGQVIVSTALTDFGEVVLRVRDTGNGLKDDEVAAALEPFRNTPPSDQAPDPSALSLSLTKALVEANRAQFHIRTAPQSGTLIEVVFPHALARA